MCCRGTPRLTPPPPECSLLSCKCPASSLTFVCPHYPCVSVHHCPCACVPSPANPIHFSASPYAPHPSAPMHTFAPATVPACPEPATCPTQPCSRSGLALTRARSRLNTSLCPACRYRKKMKGHLKKPIVIGGTLTSFQTRPDEGPIPTTVYKLTPSHLSSLDPSLFAHCTWYKASSCAYASSAFSAANAPSTSYTGTTQAQATRLTLRHAMHLTG